MSAKKLNSLLTLTQVLLSFFYISLVFAAPDNQRFDQYFIPASCTGTQEGSTAQELRELRESEVRYKDVYTYPITCASKDGVVTCSNMVDPNSCLKSATFSYNYATKQSQLTEVWNNCVTNRSRDGIYNFTCNAEVLTVESRATIGLHTAACSGNVQDVLFYLNVRDVKIDYTNPQTGKTTLGCAFASGNAEIVRAIINNGFVSVNLYRLDQSGLLPIQHATSAEQLLVLNELIPGYDINHIDGFGTNCVSRSNPSFPLAAARELWPEARPMQLPPTEDCFQMKDGEVVGFSCRHTDVVIPEKINGINVTSIGSGAFKLKDLKSVVIPRGVRTIKDSAFAANDLKELSLPSGLRIIGDKAFEFNNLIEISLPENLAKLGKNSFSSNDLKRVRIPEGITEIPEMAFFGNDLIEVSIPNTVSNIMRNAFSFNEIAELTIPNGVTEIGAESFICNKLTELRIGNQVKIIGKHAFASLRDGTGRFAGGGVNCYSRKGSLDEVKIPKSVELIDQYAFYQTKINSVVFEPSETTLSYKAFADCDLTKLTLPQGIQILPPVVFANNKLSTLHIPNSVKMIDTQAFRNNNLTSVEIFQYVELKEDAFDYNVQVIRKLE